jgi:hypothetical protein
VDFLEHLGMGGSHGAEEGKPKADIQDPCKRRRSAREMVAVMRNGLGLGLRPLFIGGNKSWA